MVVRMSKGSIERTLSQHELPDNDKSNHISVQYEHPANGRNHCGICSHFIRSHIPRCEIVVSPIRSEDWCNEFEKD